MISRYITVATIVDATRSLTDRKQPLPNCISKENGSVLCGVVALFTGAITQSIGSFQHHFYLSCNCLPYVCLQSVIKCDASMYNPTIESKYSVATVHIFCDNCTRVFMDRLNFTPSASNSRATFSAHIPFYL